MRDLTDCPLTGLNDATYTYLATTTAQQPENAPCNYQAQHFKHSTTILRENKSTFILSQQPGSFLRPDDDGGTGGSVTVASYSQTGSYS